MDTVGSALRFYAITPDGKELDELLTMVEGALKGGITLLQLREKNREMAEEILNDGRLQRLCNSYSVPLIINDFWDLAKEYGADGVHIGQEDGDASSIRGKLGDKIILGITANSVERAIRAQEAGADYIGCGAVFPTGTKSGAELISTGVLKDICESVNIPAVAIGGIDEENMLSLKGTGISGVSLVSAVFGTEDIHNTCLKLNDLTLELLRKV
ncbi:MAG: thiamine phosphate synthase [Tissierellia bacterium]|nr:thiamine phosphate synthase [Tissierellia bacterium]